MTPPPRRLPTYGLKQPLGLHKTPVTQGLRKRATRMPASLDGTATASNDGSAFFPSTTGGEARRMATATTSNDGSAFFPGGGGGEVRRMADAALGSVVLLHLAAQHMQRQQQQPGEPGSQRGDGAPPPPGRGPLGAHGSGRAWAGGMQPGPVAGGGLSRVDSEYKLEQVEAFSDPNPREGSAGILASAGGSETSVGGGVGPGARLLRPPK